MLVTSQRFDVASLGIRRHFRGVHAHGIWVHVVRQVGMGGDERLVPTLGFGRTTSDRLVIGVDLEGESAMTFGGKSLVTREGSVSVLPGRGSYRARLEPSGRVSWSMIVEIDRRVHPSAPATESFGMLDGLGDARRIVSSLCDAIDRAWEDPTQRPGVHIALDALLAFMRARGLPVPAIDLRDAPEVSETLQRLARAADLALSQTGERPMIVDVEEASGIGARTLQRAMPALCALWGQAPESFRAHTRRVVLGRACALMTNPRATTEGAARVLGFSTPNALCRAMAKAGLPSPGAVRERFKAIA